MPLTAPACLKVIVMRAHLAVGRVYRRCGCHDLRHFAVTTALDEGVEMTIVSKTVRHSTFSTTANLTRRAARQAVDAIAHALDREERRRSRKPKQRQTGYARAA
ncbi:hypothetical protein ACIA8O_13145 [Kitasatospora sp. NPDC051853]|uniref:hypothetical protein n=1 Tax=Kitasatospora sp. NPDC051853 TaxID=3364058 RepID=UPI0037BB8911